jgi:hypothetical protein
VYEVFSLHKRFVGGYCDETNVKGVRKLNKLTGYMSKLFIVRALTLLHYIMLFQLKFSRRMLIKLRSVFDTNQCTKHIHFNIMLKIDYYVHFG